MDTATLEIGLFPANGGIVADIRFAPSATATDQVLGRSLPVAIDAAQLCALTLDPTIYAQELTAMLFQDERAATAWKHARTYSDTVEVPLHVRIRIADDLPFLHDIRWELLRDPNTNEDLSRSGRVWISRTLDRLNNTQRERPNRKMIRTLVALSSPSDLSRFGLASIEQRVGLQAAQALHPLPTMLLDGSARHYANLETLSRGLWRYPGLLVVFAHGLRTNGDTMLVMQDDEGQRQMVPASEFIEMLGGLPHMPVAVILISCMSGGLGNSADENLTSLGERLSRRGISAVLALAGLASMNLTETFVPTLLANLAHEGDILTALGQARASLHVDRWSPRLWLNGRDGQLWDEPKGQRWLVGAGLWG
ncbi:hypothetical protein OSCT_1398 [Oscillochloris trichoides DG-6]|uniref:CHAT domain-containing protein n=1 Tax=Oscillochloris trichoides DG-6 TaxID=765420 RepID=E1IDJ7_9CHLR|nr:CHAT domain-containing protein [Oscillochloris trichoides]EFO80705.1 hypothetical protein OSCT_1398 [Oscillochloris trichoides DG-6]